MIRPARITWAAAVLLFGSGIALALGIFAFYVPGADRTVSIVAVVIGAWGILTGIGLLRLWRWARISVLIVGGLSTYVGIALIPLILFLQIPVPPEFQDQITTAAATQTAMRIKIALVVVLVLLGVIGFSWAYLFSSSTIKKLFGTSEPTRSRPFNLSVLGWYFVITATFGISSFWQGVQHSPPITMVFGSLLVGRSALVVRASYAAVQLFLGGGLLYRRTQSRRFAIYYLLFECLNIIVFLLRPGREARIAAYHDMLGASHPTFDLSTAFWSHYMKAWSIEWAMFALVMIWFLARQDNTLDPANA